MQHVASDGGKALAERFGFTSEPDPNSPSLLRFKRAGDLVWYGWNGWSRAHHQEDKYRFHRFFPTLEKALLDQGSTAYGPDA